MRRRDFLQLAAGATAGLTLPVDAAPPSAGAFPGVSPLLVHRFGVNYTPSKNWYYCWNDFDPDAVARDFDAIAALGADHLRLMLLWPSFQPNPRTVSEAHLARLDRVMTLADERRLDVCVVAFNGWLSGYIFAPPINDRSTFYESARSWDMAKRYLRTVAATVAPRRNFLGFDLGNEMNCCWETPDLRSGDAWLERALTLVEALAPAATAHVQGVDHQPWFAPTTFSARTLAARQPIVALHCWTRFTGALKRGGPLDPPSLRLGAAMSALARAYAGDPRKPTWVQEYGASPTWMDGRDIPAYLEKATLGGIASGVSWHTWWASHDIDRKFQFGEMEYDLGLLTVDNRPKEQAQAFRAVAEAYRGQPVKFPSGDDLPPPPEFPTSESTWAWLLAWMDHTA